MSARLPHFARVFFTIVLLCTLILPAASTFAQDTPAAGVDPGSTNTAVIHYFRADGVYGGWGLHVWKDAAAPTEWGAPLAQSGADDFGVYWEVPLVADAAELGLIIHSGDTKDPGPDMFLDLTQSAEAWIISGDLKLYTERPDLSVRPNGDLSKARAQWVSSDTIAYPAPAIPAVAPVAASADVTATAEVTPAGTITEATFVLLDAANGGMQLTVDGVMGSGVTTTPLTLDPAGLSPETLVKFPQLDGYLALRLPADRLNQVPSLLKSQLALQVTDPDGALIDATSLQIPGVLDQLFAYDGPLGVTWQGDVPTVSVWAPTAKRVRLLLFDDAAADTPAQTITMKATNGVWSVTGEPTWRNSYYLYEVRVLVPSTGLVEVNVVTDPYALSLSANSTRSQIVDLNDPALMPAKWKSYNKPPLQAPEDITLYELHLRDFSAFDASVPQAARGTYLAFTDVESDGMQHLASLADAGLSHVHLLPTFDIATIDEDKATWVSPDPAQFATMAPDSEKQQSAVVMTQNVDAYNWGYDPFHFFAPEGSYSTNPEGGQRILEYRQMVQTLNQVGLRVVNDVVFNHTNAAGQDAKSVLDQIVPGYYHRLNADGVVETSTCCQNTATEHAMMRKLMLDAVRVWATDYKVDGFRFDLMGHHMLADMKAVRAMLDGLTLAKDGVDGKAIYIYGEGWNFGEVADNARGVNASQLNLAGTGIGSFNDRLRDAVRGVGPFDTGADLQRQGFVTGLSIQPNRYDWGSDAAAAERLGLVTDWIKVGMAGNLKNYLLIDHRGYALRGDEVQYNGAPVGYTEDPQENIAYADSHDNQTLFDTVQLAAPAEASVAERAQMAALGHAIVLLSQGIPFQQAGSEMLRSKSFDRDSYNSGDWFNHLDFTFQDNGFGRGLPPEEKNGEDWPVMQPLLANADLQPTPALMQASVANFEAFLSVRASTPLLRLQSADEVNSMLRFHNVGPEGIPGLIVMSVVDSGEEESDIDSNLEAVVALINANPLTTTFTEEGFGAMNLTLAPALAALDGSAGATYANGVFTVPGRTAVVFTATELPAAVTEQLSAYDDAVQAIREKQPSVAQINAPTAAAADAAPAGAVTAGATPTATVTTTATAATTGTTSTTTTGSAPVTVSFPGTIAGTLGGAEWAPSDPVVQAVNGGNGIWTLSVTLPPGTFEFKAALNGTWDVNYGLGGVAGGDNIPLTLDQESVVLFVYEQATNAVYAMVDGQVVAGR